MDPDRCCGLAHLISIPDEAKSQNHASQTHRFPMSSDCSLERGYAPRSVERGSGAGQGQVHKRERKCEAAAALGWREACSIWVTSTLLPLISSASSWSHHPGSKALECGGCTRASGPLVFGERILSRKHRGCGHFLGNLSCSTRGSVELLAVRHQGL